MADTRLLRMQPWRLIPGDRVHVIGWPATATVEVVAQIGQRLQGMPYYRLQRQDGSTFEAAQIHLSKKQIPTDG